MEAEERNYNIIYIQSDFEVSGMDEIRVSEVIGKENEQTIAFEPGESAVIQMPVGYINRITGMVKNSQSIFLLESSMPSYNRLTVREQLRFIAKLARLPAGERG